jgi:hypothetical protein
MPSEPEPTERPARGPIRFKRRGPILRIPYLGAIVQRLRVMPGFLQGYCLTGMLLGSLFMAAPFLPLDWKSRDGRSLRLLEVWTSGIGPGLFAIGLILAALAVAFYRGWQPVRFLLTGGLAVATLYGIWIYGLEEWGGWMGAAVWTVLFFFYFFAKPNVVAYFEDSKSEPTPTNASKLS